MKGSAARPVRAGDKVCDVLARDERLVEVFARQSPHFGKLRNPGLRRVMARLVTVEQAARICGAPIETLVNELNRARGIEAPADGASPADVQTAAVTAAPRFAPGACVVELDVREDLRQGREPFSRIMGAVAALGGDEVLCLRATFEPVPLFSVMAKRGFDHAAEQLAADDWRVWFYRNAGGDGGAAATLAATARPADSQAAGPGEIVLDVRGLEPPEPMQRTLEALEQLPDGAALVQVNVRVPHFLLPILRERGFDFEIHEPNPERVVVRIWRVSPAASTRDTRADDDRCPS
jgi:uncharacterized protein (DUF2249 family)